MPPKFLQFAPELPQFTYLLLVQCLISSRCKPIFISSSCLPLVPSSASDLGTDVNGSLTYNTKSSPHVHFPPQTGPCACWPTTQTTCARGYGPKGEEGDLGHGQGNVQGEIKKIRPQSMWWNKKPHCSVTIHYYTTFLQVRKNIWHK